MEQRNKTLISIFGFLTIITLSLAFGTFDFVNSYKFVRYERINAVRNKDSSFVIRYMDIEKIIDNTR